MMILCLIQTLWAAFFEIIFCHLIAGFNDVSVCAPWCQLPVCVSPVQGASPSDGPMHLCYGVYKPAAEHKGKPTCTSKKASRTQNGGLSLMQSTAFQKRQSKSRMSPLLHGFLVTEVAVATDLVPPRTRSVAVCSLMPLH